MSKDMELRKFIATTIGEYLNENRFEKRDEEQYKNCLMSDLTRMEIVDLFFDKNKENKVYNIEIPDYFKLIDDWDGYDDQVYIQNNLNNDEFVYWEGWVDECWKAVYLKPEYKNLSKTDTISKIVKDRFPRIGEEFGFKLKKYNYFKFRGKYIMKVVFHKLIS